MSGEAELEAQSWCERQRGSSARQSRLCAWRREAAGCAKRGAGHLQPCLDKGKWDPSAEELSQF